MNLPRGWPLLSVAGVAVGIAVYAGPNQGVATAGAIVALLAIGIFLIGPARRTTVDLRPPPPPREFDAASPFRASLAAGRSGRTEVVALLDELERRSHRPDRPTTLAMEVARLRGLSRADFRAYVRGRLEELEGGSR